MWRVGIAVDDPLHYDELEFRREQVARLAVDVHLDDRVDGVVPGDGVVLEGDPRRYAACVAAIVHERGRSALYDGWGGGGDGWRLRWRSREVLAVDGGAASRLRGERHA